MRFKSGKAARRKAKIEHMERLESWHTWFAWYPVRSDKGDTWMWWEDVRRKYYFYRLTPGGNWHYEPL